MLGKVLKWSAVLFGLLAGGLTIFLVFFFDFDEELNAQKDKYIPQLEAQLGRDIEVGSVETTLFPVLGAQLKGVTIKGATPDAPPLLTLDTVSFELEWWAAVKSAGTEIKLKSLVLDGLVVNLERQADGTLSYQDIVDRMATGESPPSEPLTPDAKRFIEALQLERIALTNGSIRLVDQTAGGAETRINNLEVSVEDVVLASPFEVTLKAAVFAEDQNFEVQAKLGPIPIGKPDAAFPISWVSLKAQDVDLAGIVPYLGDALPVAIDTARLTADVKVEDPLAARGGITSKGSVQIADVRLGSPAGEPFTLAVTPNLKFLPKQGQIDLTGLSVSIDDMKLNATGKAFILARRPRFEGVEIKTTGMDFDKLLARLPLIAQALPPGAKLGGPFAISVNASGDAEKQVFQAELEFGGAKIMIPGALSKPAGTPLGLTADATLSSNALDIRAARLRAASLDLKVAGTVKNFANPVLNITGGTGRFSIDGLMRLIPSVRAAVPPDVKIAGQAGIDLRFVGNAESMDGKFEVGIYNADLAVPGTTLKGSGTINATVKGAPKAMAVNVTAGLTGMALQAGDGFRKAGGTPMNLTANGGLGGNSLNLSSFAVQLGPLDVKGSGSVNLKTTAMDLRADIPKFSFKALSAIIPALGEGLMGRSHFGGKLAFSGSPSVPSSIDVRLDRFEFDIDKTSFNGKLSLANLDAPKVNFTVNSPYVNLDTLFPPSEDSAESSSGAPPPIIRKIDARGALTIAKGRAADMDFTNFVGQLTMKNGVIRFEKLDFAAYEGTFSGAQSKFDIGGPKFVFDLDMNVRRVNVAQILTDQANLPRTISGRATTQVRLKGKGSEWREVRQTLAGDLSMALAEGKFESLKIEDAVFGKIQRKVPFLKLPRRTQGTNLKNLTGHFSIANGRMKLNKPMAFQTAQGPMSLNGSVGLDSTLDLIGNLQIPASVIRKLSKGKIKLDAPLPVALQIGGTLKSPKISGIDSAALLTALIGGSAAGVAMEKLEKAKAEAEKKARELKARAEKKARDAVNKVKGQAEKKANELKSRAKREADKAKKKAEDAAKSAADKAKSEALKRLKGLF